MNEKCALVAADDGPAKKKMMPSAETHARPLLMLPLDFFVKQVLVFCKRKEVATIMAIPLIRDHFRLDALFCPTHGTRLNKEDDSSALECIDCVMEERNHFRCDQCDDFHDEDELHNGTCGKVICDECKYSAPCSDCEKDFHLDCASCGMVTYCDSCDMVFCGTCQQLKTCDGCNVDVACRACRVCREEGWVYCKTCAKEYCESCFYLRDMLDFCEHCENIYCHDCGCVETCRSCEDSICETCRSQLDICSVCGDNSCSDNYLRFASCSECEKCFCSDCDKGPHSYKSENALCTSCYTKAK